MLTFGENLKRIRKEKGLTQKEVVVGMGVSSVFISYYEKDTRKPKPETIRRFAAALHCSIDDLLKDTSLAIKALYQEPKTDYKSFCEWVASEIFTEDWEFNKDSFAEIACRKLSKLGIVASEGNVWKLKESEG